MGNVDSLNIKVDAAARDANQQLDELVQRMIQLRSTINGINVGNLNKITGSIQNFSKAATGLRRVKTSDFTRMAKSLEKITNINSANLDKSAQSVEKAAGSLQRASSVSKKAISAGLNFDSSGAQNMQKAIQEFSKQYANAGKGNDFEGTLANLEKNADKLRKKLDKLAEKEERILTVGGTSAQSKGFKNLQFDISKTLNQLSELETKISKLRETNARDDSIEIIRPGKSEKSLEYFSTELERAKESMRVNENTLAKRGLLDTPISGLESNLEELRSMYPEARELIFAYMSEAERLKGIQLTTPIAPKTGERTSEKKQKSTVADKGGNDSFRNYYQEMASLNKDLRGLEQSGKMGSDEWEQVYLKLQKVSLEAKEYKNMLNRHAAGLDEDIKKTDSLGNHVEELKAKVKALQDKGLSFGDPKFDNTYKELHRATGELKKYQSDLTDSGNTARSVSGKIGNAFHSIWNQTKRAGRGVVDFGSKIRKVTAHFGSMSNSADGLVKKLGKLFLGFVSLRSAGNFLKDSVQSSMDYIEEYNYFNTTMEKIAGEWSKDYKKYGYEGAEEYGKSFKNRITQVMGKMTDFKMEDDGTLTDVGEKNLGLDVTQMTNYAAGIAQVTNSVGLTGEASIVTSKALSMLAGDMSSFRNLNMETVMNNFSSGLIGQSRSLYKYGIDITNATLAAYAHELGIKKNISAMTQGEKMQLRMIAILRQSKVAWGDLAKTINSPSNQLRLLQNNFKSLARTIGNIFLPVVAKVLPYVNGLVIAIRRLFEWTASMLGISLKDVIGESGGGYSDAFDGLEEDADNASDAVDNTTDSVKKLARQLMGFDELNVITTNNDSGKDNDKDGSGGVPIDLTDQLSAALADYEKVWNDAYENMTSDAEKFADKLTKLFKNAWISGDGSDIGSAIATWINKGISWVNNNVDTFSAGLEKVANIMATSFNGFVENLNWDGLGTAIGKSLKAYFDAETHFFDTVNWVNLGKSLATSLNTAIETGVIQSYFDLIASKLKAGIETAFGAVTTFNFSGLGSAIGQGITDFFRKMSIVNKDTGLNGWEELGQTISESIIGISDAIIVALETVPWGEVGQAIADFIKNIKWEDIVWNLGKMFSAFVEAFKELLKGTGMSDSLADLTVSVAIGGWIIKKLSKTALGKLITKKLGSKFSVSLKKVGAVIKDWLANKKDVAVSKLKDKIVKALGKITTTLKNVGAKVKNWIAESVNKSGLVSKIVEKLGTPSISLSSVAATIGSMSISSIGFFTSPAVDDIVRRIEMWFTEKVIPKVSLLQAAADLWSGFCDTLCDVMDTAGNIIVSAFEDALDISDFGLTGNDAADGFIQGFVGALVFPGTLLDNLFLKPIREFLGIHSPSTKFYDIATYCVSGFMNGFNLKDKIEEALKGLGVPDVKSIALNVKGSFDNKAQQIRDWFADKKERAKEFLARAKGKIEKTFGSVKEAWNGFREKSKEVFVRAKGKIENAFNSVKEAWKGFKGGAKTVWAKAKGTAEKVFDSIGEKWNSFKEGAKNLWVKAKGDVEKTFSNATETWESVKDGAKDIWIKAKGTVESSFGKVSDTWDKVKEGTKELWSKLKGKTEESFSNVKEKWGKISSTSKTFLAKMTGNIQNSFTSAKDKFDAIRSKTATLTANAKEKATNVFKNIKAAWNSITSKTSVLTATFNDMFTRPLKSAWNAIAKAINGAIKTINKLPGPNIGARLPILAKGGIFSGGTWHNIAKYADGGLPGMGQMFVAREAGPELVGTIGGHTAVMNNNQIVASVSDGVFNALNPVLTSLVNAINLMVSTSANGNGDVYVEIDGDNIARVVKRKDTEHRKRTGKGMFEV